MRERTLAAIAICIAIGGCSEKQRDGETRGAFGAASGVTRAGPGDPRAPRIVPLGPIAGDVQILYGNPDSAGPFVMRIHELAGTVIPPHTHPVDENVTVVQGTWYFGFGERWDSTALRALKAGDYAFAPAGATMFGASPDEAVVQVHGTGPFHIHWRDGLKVLGEPGGASAFRYRRGDQVATPRGPGRIRQGYASGAVVQYEIERPDGGAFMASERDVRVRPRQP
jgi:quercetin dioxygenase-like cupin family protein